MTWQNRSGYSRTRFLGRNHRNKINFFGTVVSVKARIPLIRSFDQVPTHQYQGYTLILDGEVDGVSRSRFKVAIGPKAHEQHQFHIGDTIKGSAVPVPDSKTEWAEFYKVNGLKLMERIQPYGEVALRNPLLRPSRLPALQSRPRLPRSRPQARHGIHG